jgi:hydroxymethylglutaryl-CoA reductase (NADPH)
LFNFLKAGQGVSTKVLSDGMTRGPVVKFQSAMKAAECKEWLEDEDNFLVMKREFDATSRFAKLETIKCCVVGRYLFIRFSSKTGDAMGMNMLSKVGFYFK